MQSAPSRKPRISVVPSRDRAEHRRAVRNRLVARDAHFPADPAAGTRDEALGRIHGAAAIAAAIAASNRSFCAGVPVEIRR